VTLPKRFSFWVIVAGAQPTAFRARNAEDLLPTLKQLQRTQPSAELKWFERGRFWPSQEAAIADSRLRRQSATGRKLDWRPGGTHADPKARYEQTRDQKRARFKRNLIRDRVNQTRPARPGPSKRQK
jgi:hypothetical protein